MSGPSSLIKDLISYLRENYTFPTDVKLDFNMLNTGKTCMCLALNEDNKVIEKVADVTGTAMSGTIILDVVYRTMALTNGLSDLDMTEVIDSLIDFIKLNYRENVGVTGFFVESIKCDSRGVLSKVYQGGVRDYKGIFTLKYERMV